MSMIDSQSYIIDDALPSPTTDPDEIDSLPESAESDDIESEDDLEESDAEKEWKESLQQLELLLTMVVVPYVGKYFGRKCAYWGWAKYMEWKYPVEVVFTSKKTFRAAGILEAAAPL
ncbi:hypothetical protein MMC24_005045 [Lignoscripta atroalba]|nr:hypothetical protein [Lignoscripta atroalba]